MVLIFFHEIFRINVKLNFNFKFLSGIVSWALKKFGGQILKNARQIYLYCLFAVYRPTTLIIWLSLRRFLIDTLHFFSLLLFIYIETLHNHMVVSNRTLFNGLIFR